MIGFWAGWVAVTCVVLVIIAVRASDDTLLILVPFPMFLLAAVFVPFLSPWSSPAAAWAIIGANSVVVLLSGLVWFGVGVIFGPVAFVYAVAIRSVLALFRRERIPDADSGAS